MVICYWLIGDAAVLRVIGYQLLVIGGKCGMWNSGLRKG